MFKGIIGALSISLLVFALVIALSNFLQQVMSRKRRQVMVRLRGRFFHTAMVQEEDEDILSRPFMERTFGYISQQLVAALRQITPLNIQEKVEARLVKAGHPRGLKAMDFLALESIIAVTSFFYFMSY